MDIEKRMRGEDIKVLTSHQLLKIKDNAIVVKNMKEKREYEIQVDRVVMSTGMKPNRKLYEQLRESTDKLFILGDAVAPRRIGNAVKEGFEKAYTLT
jgi:thioredoxin reductase